MDGWSTGRDTSSGDLHGTPPPPQRRPTALTLGDVLDGMFRLLITHWRVYLVALGALLVPANIVGAWLASESIGGIRTFTDAFVQGFNNPDAPLATPPPAAATGGTASALLQFLQIFVISPLSWGLATFLAVEAYHAMNPTVGRVWRLTLRRYWPLLGLLILIYLIVFGALLAIALPVGVVIAASQSAPVAVIMVVVAMAAFAWIMVRLSLALPALIAEGLGAGAAIGRSWRLVRGRFWPLFGRWIVVGIIITVLSFVGMGAFLLLGLLAGPAGAIVGAVAGWVIASMFATPLLVNAATLLYYDSRIRTEAYDLDVLTAQMAAPSSPAPPPPPPAPEPPFG